MNTGYSYEWIIGQKPHLIKKYSDTVQYGELRTDRCSWFINEFFLKLVYLTTHGRLQGRNMIIQITIHQSSQAKGVDRQVRGDPNGMDHHPAIGVK